MAAKKIVKKTAPKKPLAKKSPAKKAAKTSAKKMTGKATAKKSAKAPTKKAASKSAGKLTKSSNKKSSTKAAKASVGKAAAIKGKSNLKPAIEKSKATVTAAQASSSKSRPSSTSTKPATFVAPVKAKPRVSFEGFMTPLDDRILVRLTEAERKTAGGLYIPDTVSDVSGNLSGEVVAVGRGHRDEKGRLRPMDVMLHDRVVFTQYSGSKIKIENEDLIILRESEVMGVVSK